MVKKFAVILFSIGLAASSQAQYPYERFDPETEKFDSILYTEYYFLNAEVLEKGEIDWENAYPETGLDYFPNLLYEEFFIPNERRKNLLKGYLDFKDIEEVCGHLDSAICTNSKGSKAKYFVIHDTSFPNYLDEDFPEDINDTTWQYNDLQRYFGTEDGRTPLAHAFINRRGEVLSQLDFSIPWRATKFELQKIDEAISKGLFIHVELVQPRKSDSTAWEGNDILAPKQGFTDWQYQSLALLYIAASVRAGHWLMPTYHAVLDAGIKDGHDDPQNFQRRKFARQVNFLMQRMDRNYARPRYFGFEDPKEDSLTNEMDLWATWYYVPTLRSVEGGIPILNQDEQETGFYLDSCNWCDAAIEGTVIFETDSGNVVMNYAGRSKKIQMDCRKCPGLANYSGNEKSGKVLFRESMDYGEGVGEYFLVPFRTIATDPEVIPHGSLVYIPSAKGTIIPWRGQNYSHDGYFFAGDTGSAIKGNHMDVFVGTETSNPFDFVKSAANGTFKAYIVNDVYDQLHMKNLHIIP